MRSLPRIFAKTSEAAEGVSVGCAAMSSPVVGRPVTSRGDRRAFIELPYRLYSGERNWVPPLRFERRQFLDRGKNPYFEHAKAEYFLAERDGRVVGRITAQVDRLFQEVQGSRGGHFGF